MLAAVLALGSVGQAAAAENPRRDRVAAATGDPVLIGAGDIASCSNDGDRATARLVSNEPGTVFTVGDNAYQAGTEEEFQRCYHPTWGRFKDRTRPAVGNHEYRSPGAKPYYAYFGTSAGRAGRGWYAYNLGTWRIYVLNSNCSIVGCFRGSRQERWLRADLANHPHRCVLAYWHHALFSSGPHGGHTSVRRFWEDLYQARAEVVINGHDHDYERFARMAPNGGRVVRGIREFVVGTGGASHYRIKTLRRNSDTHDDATFGVLRLTLHPTSYSWEFVPVAGGSFRDSGSGTCI
jgi:calcineurin-like phosphoesterase family protein